MAKASDESLHRILTSNSPWQKDRARLVIPKTYKREAYYQVEQELHAPHGMAVLIKGPRRVGKTEIQKQLIWELIEKKGIPPERVLYLSFDDVQIVAERSEHHVKIVQGILDLWAQRLGAVDFDGIVGPAYCFFDEVQAVANWALLIKNRVERNPNVRIVLSGSAAHSIFDQALKVLLGRVVDVRLTTFSFREFLESRGLVTSEVIAGTRKAQAAFERGLDPDMVQQMLREATQGADPEEYQRHIALFLREGGFPQLWEIGSEELARAQFIDEHYVRKVTLEDLMLLQKIRKPELYERLLRHLFARPGQEYNQNKIAMKLGTTSVTLADAMRLLEQTDLLIVAERFSKKAEPLKVRDVKIYPIDLALTYAMTKIAPTLDAPEEKGFVAESLVAQTFARLRGLAPLAFLKSEDARHPGEIDFYLRSDTHDCPVEVKFQSGIRPDDTSMLRRIISEKTLAGGLLITPTDWTSTGNIHAIPLWALMLLA